MTIVDRVRAFFGTPAPTPSLIPVVDGAGGEWADLPLRREAATSRRQEGYGVGMIDQDDPNYRRLSGGSQKMRGRDLSPMAQDRMLEIAWYLYEQNPFARRLITCMTDLVVGEGLAVDGKDPKITEAAERVWNHPINKLGDRAREFHNALSVNGELVLPVGVNDITGVPTLGFIDPYSVDRIEHRIDNVMVPEWIVLKRGIGEAEGKRLKIVALDPLTNTLEGEVFYHAINKFPNSSRGRSDYLPLGDWLELFDQYMFAEVARVRMLSAFVYDLKVMGAPDQAAIDARIAGIGKLDSGEIFGHNEKEELTAVSPALGSSDRSETARLMTIHIAGSLGMPIQWFGWPDSTNATMQGQNDIAMKTPAARQKDFGGFMNTILRYGIEKQRGKNRVLFKDIKDDTFGITMPEISSKDISRVGNVLSSVVTSMDTAMANRTASRRVSTMIQLALIKHLGSGLDFTADDVMEEADADADDAAERADELMAAAAASVSKQGGGVVGKRPVGPGGRTNAPIQDRGDQ